MIGGPDEAPSTRDGTPGGPPVPEPRAASSGDGSPLPGRAGAPPSPSPGAAVPLVPPQRRGPGPARHPEPSPRPRIVDDPGILGLSRIARSRMGSRLFTWFFVLVFTVIVVEMVVAILDPEW